MYGAWKWQRLAGGGGQDNGASYAILKEIIEIVEKLSQHTEMLSLLATQNLHQLVTPLLYGRSTYVNSRTADGVVLCPPHPIREGLRTPSAFSLSLSLSLALSLCLSLSLSVARTLLS